MVLTDASNEIMEEAAASDDPISLLCPGCVSNPEPLPCNALGLRPAGSVRCTVPVTTLGKAETVSPSPCHGLSPTFSIVIIKAAGFRKFGMGIAPCLLSAIG